MASKITAETLLPLSLIGAICTVVVIGSTVFYDTKAHGVEIEKLKGQKEKDQEWREQVLTSLVEIKTEIKNIKRRGN